MACLSNVSVDALLAARGSTQKWLAGKLGIDHTLLNHYLAGRRSVPDGLYDCIADVLQVPVSFVRPEPNEPVVA